jgi:tetratricopeptide (TPR) repeat protein
MGTKGAQRRQAVEYNPTLSLCMIVRDEEDSLGGCLEDAKGLTDEVVIIDTGSSDRTVEIAKEYGARVFDFPWSDDFSAARNESIRRAAGDYILWLDADDRLSPEARESFRRLKRGLSPLKNLAYRLSILNRKLDGEAALNYQLRIFPNVEGALFEGRVHERIEPSLRRLGIGIKRAEVVITHTGYEDDEAVRTKAARNLGILLNERRDEERTPRQYFHLAQSYFGIKDYARCMECLDRVRSGGKGSEFHKYAVPLAVDCHLQLGQGDEALGKLRHAVMEFPGSGYIHYVLGSALTRLGRHEEAVPCLVKAAALGIEVESFPIPQDIGTRLDTCLGRALEGTGLLNPAEEAYRRALEGSPDHIDTLRALGFLMSRQGRFEEALVFLEKARERASRMEKGIWLALARIYRFFERHEEALQVYGEVLEEDPLDRDALSGMAGAGMAAGRADCIIYSFDGLLRALNMNAGIEITSFADLARLGRDIGRGLQQAGDTANAALFREIALQLEPSMIPASGVPHG